MLFHPLRDLETLEPRQRRQRSTTTNITELLKARGGGGGDGLQRGAGGVWGHVFELLTLIVSLNYHAPWRDRCRCNSKDTRS